jgi:Transposase, Mutator family
VLCHRLPGLPDSESARCRIGSPRALNLDGLQDVLSLWTAQNEGAKSRLEVITNLKNRGVADILIACVDGLMGFPETTGRRWAFEERLPTA